MDVITAAKFLRTHPDLNKKPLFVYAFSMGAVASIEAQSQDASLFDAMILDCPFDSTENVLNRLVSNIKFTLFGYEFKIPGASVLQKYAFHPYVQSLIKLMLKTVANMEPRQVETKVCEVSPAQSIAKVKVPCFFIHCKKDEKVPLEAIKRVYAAATGPKILWVTNGRSHYDSYFYNPERYVQQVRLFVDQVLAGQWKNSIEQRIIEDEDDQIKV
jgi:pimeloyl-ACP methyl ester carboxylesterase